MARKWRRLAYASHNVFLGKDVFPKSMPAVIVFVRIPVVLVGPTHTCTFVYVLGMHRVPIMSGFYTGHTRSRDEHDAFSRQVTGMASRMYSTIGTDGTPLTTATRPH